MEEQSSDTRILDFLQQKHQSVKLTDILYFPGKTAFEFGPKYFSPSGNMNPTGWIVYPTKMGKSGLNYRTELVINQSTESL